MTVTRKLVVITLAALMWMPINVMAEPRVAVSIAPVHSLVESLMQGVASAELLIRDGQSPHNATLSPSAVRAVSRADLVVWVGPELEYQLVDLMAQVDANKQIMLLELDGLDVLSLAQHDGHHDGHQEEESSSDQHEGQQSNVDPHIWLATRNASRIVTAVVNWLSQFDPENASIYRANSRQLFARIEQTRLEIDNQIAPLRGKRWVAFHNAYQYFQREFNIAPVATVTLNPHQPLSAKRIKALRQQVLGADVECVFGEPQFNPAIIETIVENTDARTGVLDPTGSQFAHGREHWFLLMNQMLKSFKACLQV